MLLRACALLALSLAFCGAASARGDDTVECRSRNYQQAECDADFREAELRQQLSESACVEGRNWGYDRRSGTLWVSDGCAGVFGEGSGPRHYDDDRRYDNDGRYDNDRRYDDRRYDDRHDRQRGYERREEVAECRSSGYAFTRCGGNWRAARLLEQLSNSACVEGDSWGIDDDGLWVDKGCAGRFAGY